MREGLHQGLVWEASLRSTGPSEEREQITEISRRTVFQAERTTRAKVGKMQGESLGCCLRHSESQHGQKAGWKGGEESGPSCRVP